MDATDNTFRRIELTSPKVPARLEPNPLCWVRHSQRSFWELSKPASFRLLTSRRPQPGRRSFFWEPPVFGSGDPLPKPNWPASRLVRRLCSSSTTSSIISRKAIAGMRAEVPRRRRVTHGYVAAFSDVRHRSGGRPAARRPLIKQLVNRLPPDSSIGARRRGVTTISLKGIAATG
jgi:hypothetical protein